MYFYLSFTDKCSDGTDDCHRFADCLRGLGTFLCECWDGYEGDGKNCTGNKEFFYSFIIEVLY